MHAHVDVCLECAWFVYFCSAVLLNENDVFDVHVGTLLDDDVYKLGGPLRPLDFGSLRFGVLLIDDVARIDVRPWACRAPSPSCQCHNLFLLSRRVGEIVERLDHGVFCGPVVF